MNKKEIQKVVNDTENSLKEQEKEKQVKRIKQIVTRLLKRKDALDEEKAEIEKKIKYVKMDLDDLKEGRLDRIEERQVKDKDAKKNAVVIIIKQKSVERQVPVSPWYQPYRFIFPEEFNTPDYTITSGSSDGTWFLDGSTASCSTSGAALTCSTVKNNVAGTYDLNDHIVHLR